jgi:hypothetical protein
MPNAGFEKVTKSQKALYGPRKLILCGFSADTQEKFKKVLNMAGLSVVPIVWASDDEAEMRVEELMAYSGDHGLGKDSRLDRAIIMGGIQEMELHHLMAVCKKAGMKNALWAALTPTSEKWTLSALLSELSAERDIFDKHRTPKTKRQT